MVPAQRGGVQNGAHAQPQLHGGSDVPIASTAPQTAEASAPQRCFRIVPKPLTSQSVSVTSDTRKPTTPAKPPGDASKGVAFQRGFISPGFMNEMQPQMGPQIPQMGNLGISMASQCPQQLGRKFGGPRKIPVKITHPDTHEELRLDKRTDSYPDGGPSAPRTHPNIPPQSQPIPSFAHPHTTTGYYANSYNPSPLYYPAPSSHPLTSSHMPPNSQARRFSYPGSQASQHVPFINPSSHSTPPVSKSGSLVHNVLDPPNLEHARDVRNVSASVPSATGPVVIKPPAGTVGQKVVDPLPNSSTVVEKGELSKPLRQSGEIMQSAGDQSILKSLRVMEKVSASATATASVEKQVSNLLSSSSDAPTEESVPVVTTTEPRRIIDRQEGAARLHHRGSGMMDNDRWNKGGAANFRTGQVPNFGVLRNPHAPKLETSDTGEQVRGADDSDKDGHEHGAKQYSRDFLLKFSVQYTELPEGFEIMSDIAQILNANVNAAPSIYYDSLPSPGRIVDRQGGAARLDRRGSGIMDDDRWNMGGAANFRTGQGPNFGVLRNPRAPTPVQQHVRGILPGPAHSVGHQGGMQRNNSDADRWQRAANFQPKGLMPSPHTPLQVMHKADRKYEVGKVSDEEQAKQRQLKAILNKLTPQNFEKLFEQVKAVNIDNATTLTGVISQIFDKALMEPTFCEMYANFCFYLAGELPDFSEDNEKITFKRLLLNKCQEEFERGEREQEEANKADEEGQVKQSEEEREEKRIKARRRMLGNIRLIGELYKKKMLTERIMHECIKKLLGQQQTPDEEDIEALCKLMSTIGEMIDHPKAKEHMDAYFERVKSLSNNMKLSSRVRFMLKDAIDLRKNKWQQRRKVEGPKKIEEVHRDAAQERQAQSSRLARGPGINPSARRGPPMEFSPRGSTMLSSPNAHMGGFRGMPAQVRGYGSQDVRTDERHSYESRTLSVPLTQRPIGDDSITLGPQGGLARGMSIRGPPSMSAAPLAEMPPSAVDSRRMTAGSNGFSSLSEQTTYNAREDPVPRYMPDRFSGPAAYDQSSVSERNLSFGGRDMRSSDHRTLPTSPPTRAHGATLTQNVPSENVLTEDHLRDMSLAAIKEFYSARDEKEVALCIKELNSPSFHPSIISLWVTDSFERKDTERHLLAKLLVKLTKTHDGTLSQPQLIKGFEAVLSTLEDAVNDAPRAPEFLGLIFAKVILENVISLNQIGQLIQEGGEKPGHLLKVGLAGNVLGSVLEIIKSEKGDSGLNEIRMSSNLRLETFRPPDPLKSRILEKFI